MAQQAIGVFVAAALPGRVRVSKPDVDVQSLGQLGVTSHLTAAIIGQALAQIRRQLYVLMTNHVHLLITPTDKEGISRVLQAVGRRYVVGPAKCELRPSEPRESPLPSPPGIVAAWLACSGARIHFRQGCVASCPCWLSSRFAHADCEALWQLCRGSLEGGPVNLHFDAYDPLNGPIANYKHWYYEVRRINSGGLKVYDPVNDYPDWGE